MGFGREENQGGNIELKKERWKIKTKKLSRWFSEILSETTEYFWLQSGYLVRICSATKGSTRRQVKEGTDDDDCGLVGMFEFGGTRKESPTLAKRGNEKSQSQVRLALPGEVDFKGMDLLVQSTTSSSGSSSKVVSGSNSGGDYLNSVWLGSKQEDGKVDFDQVCAVLQPYIRTP